MICPTLLKELPCATPIMDHQLVHARSARAGERAPVPRRLVSCYDKLRGARLKKSDIRQRQFDAAEPPQNGTQAHAAGRKVERDTAGTLATPIWDGPGAASGAILPHCNLLNLTDTTRIVALAWRGRE